MPSDPISSEATIAPIDTLALATTSRTANTADRARFDVPRWRSVSPDTSISALPTPTTPSATIATSVTGTKPMTAIGAPHRNRAIANTTASRRSPPIARAPSAPTIPPRPIAAPSTPTPASPMPRTSIARIARNVVSAPRTAVWAMNDTMTMPAGGLATSSRTPATNGMDARRSRSRRREASGTRTAAATPAARRHSTPETAAAGAAPPWAITRPATSGPANVPRLSPSAPAVFALTSSAGLVATAGSSVRTVGRTRAPAADAAATATNTSSVASARLAAATTIAPAARTRLAPISARSGLGNALVSTTTLTIVAGIMRVSDTSPTSTAPPSS